MSTWLLDLDGVVWLSGEEIPGSAAAIALLRDVGEDVVFVTNNSAPTISVLQRRLERIDIASDPKDLITAAQAAASLVPEGGSVVAIADGGVREALTQRSAVVADDGHADAVIVGWTESFTYETLATAATAVRSGARFIGTNADPTHPTPAGLRPGTGAIIAAVEVASGRACGFAGKPNDAMARLVRQRAGSISMVVGDQVATDGAFAGVLGAPFSLVLSGVDHLAPVGVAAAPTLHHVVTEWLAANR